jgi:hypothetical protein
MFWWVWRLLRDDHDWVDAKDLCPSFNQVCLDGLKFIDRIGFNRGGDSVLTRYVVGHLPLPSIPEHEQTTDLIIRCKSFRRHDGRSYTRKAPSLLRMIERIGVISPVSSAPNWS